MFWWKRISVVLNLVRRACLAVSGHTSLGRLCRGLNRTILLLDAIQCHSWVRDRGGVSPESCHLFGSCFPCLDIIPTNCWSYRRSLIIFKLRSVNSKIWHPIHQFSLCSKVLIALSWFWQIEVSKRLVFPTQICCKPIQKLLFDWSKHRFENLVIMSRSTFSEAVYCMWDSCDSHNGLSCDSHNTPERCFDYVVLCCIMWRRSVVPKFEYLLAIWLVAFQLRCCFVSERHVRCNDY